jgi:hypothetical protein
MLVISITRLMPGVQTSNILLFYVSLYHQSHLVGSEDRYYITVYVDKPQWFAHRLPSRSSLEKYCRGMQGGGVLFNALVWALLDGSSASIAVSSWSIRREKVQGHDRT